MQDKKIKVFPYYKKRFHDGSDIFWAVGAKIVGG